MEAFKKDMADLKEDLRDIKVALIGNKDLGQTGLVHKIEGNTKYIDKDRKYKQKAVGFIAGIQAIMAAVATYFAYK